MNKNNDNLIDNFIYKICCWLKRCFFTIKESRVLNSVLWRPLGAVWSFLCRFLPWVLLAVILKMLEIGLGL